MARRNWKPRGYNVLSPYLLTAKPDRVLAFFEKVFPEVRRRHVMSDEDGRVMHAELKIGDSVLMLGDPGDGSTEHCHIHLYVPDASAAYRRALKAGAKSVRKPVQKGDADKRGGFTDPTGTVTVWVGTHVGLKKARR